MLLSPIQDEEDKVEEPKLPADINKIIKSLIFDDALFLINLTKPIMKSRRLVFWKRIQPIWGWFGMNLLKFTNSLEHISMTNR